MREKLRQHYDVFTRSCNISEKVYVDVARIVSHALICTAKVLECHVA